MNKHAGGRPPKLTDDQRLEVLAAFATYIAEEKDPTIVGFCAWNETAIKFGITKDNIHDWGEFSELRKRAIEKQEAYLIDGAGKNRLNATFSIFRLKQPQHGWSDKQEFEHTGDVNFINIVPRPKDGETGSRS